MRYSHRYPTEKMMLDDERGPERAAMDRELVVFSDATEPLGQAEVEVLPNAKATNPKDIIGAGKLPIGLFPDTAVIAGAMAFLEGAVKYGRYNWRVAGVRASIYMDALQRHMMAWWNGDDIDPESGLPHTWKAIACLAIIIDATQANLLTDDRPPRLPLDDFIRSLDDKVAAIKERYADRNPKQYTIADSVQADGPCSPWPHTIAERGAQIKSDMEQVRRDYDRTYAGLGSALPKWFVE